MKHFKLTHRLLMMLGLMICLGLVGISFYLQYANNLHPCPLCILQRLGFMLLCVLFLVGLFALPGKLMSFLHGVIVTVAISGGAIAGRQIWLQHLPADSTPACGPDLNFMLSNLPFHETLALVIQGSGECAKVDWQWLGLSLAEWSLLSYSLIAILGIFIIYRWRR